MRSGSAQVTVRLPSAEVTTTSPGMKNGPGSVRVAAVPAMTAAVGVRVSRVVQHAAGARRRGSGHRRLAVDATGSHSPVAYTSWAGPSVQVANAVR